MDKYQTGLSRTHKMRKGTCKGFIGSRKRLSLSWEPSWKKSIVTLLDAIRDRCRIIQDQAATLALTLTDVAEHLNIPAAQAAHVLVLLDAICERLDDVAERLGSGLDPVALTDKDDPEKPLVT
jgi:hypothetical protein